MQATSRESLQTLRLWFDSLLRDADEQRLWTLDDELASVTTLLSRERALRRSLADSAASPDARRALVDQLFSTQVGPDTLETLRQVAAARWSRSLDLLNAIELFGRFPALTVAERAGNADEIEDELFRFGRILESEPRLERLLGDETERADQRVRLLHDVVANRVHTATRVLLEQLVYCPRGRMLHSLVTEVAELAAARRDESVAHVRAVAELTTEQEQRLAEVLASIYGRRISIQVEIDPGIVGGLVVRIGDEVIDGSLAGKLTKAREELHG